MAFMDASLGYFRAICWTASAVGHTTRYGWPNSFVSEFLGKDALPWLILRFFTGRVPRISHPGKTPAFVYGWALFRGCRESSIAARLQPEGRGAEMPHRPAASRDASACKLL